MTEEYVTLKMDKKKWEELKEFFDGFLLENGEDDDEAECDYCMGENTEDVFRKLKELFYDLMEIGND